MIGWGLIAIVACQQVAARPLPRAASAVASAPDALTTAEARQALDVLQNDKKRAEVITTLRAVVKGAQLTPGVLAEESASAPAAEAASAPASAPVHIGALTKDSLLGQVFLHVSQWLDAASVRAKRTLNTLIELPHVGQWWRTTLASPAGRQLFIDALQVSVLVFGVAWLIEWLTGWLLKRPKRKLAQRGRGTRYTLATSDPADPAHVTDARAAGITSLPRPVHAQATFAQRLPYALGAFLLNLVPVVAFFAAGSVLLYFVSNNQPAVREFVLALGNAWITLMIIFAVISLLVAPQTPNLRLLHIGDEGARYVHTWLTRIALVVVVGGGAVVAASALGLGDDARDALLKLCTLVGHVMLLVMLLRSRIAVSGYIRGDTTRQGARALLRDWLADIWPVAATALITGIWVVGALGVDNGFEKLLHFLAVTAAVLVLARVISIATMAMLGKVFRAGHAEDAPLHIARASRYFPLAQRIAYVIIAIGTVFALLEVWGFETLAWLHTGTIGPRVLSASITIIVSLLVALFVWEGVNLIAESRLKRWSDAGDRTRSVRLTTLLPIIRTAVFIAVVLVVGLTTLNQLGVNTAPLLAGASIVGVALGFGSQKLVQDFITGIFLMMENAIEVGDWVTAANVSGSVEKLSIRTAHLRSGDGSLAIVPFSAVTTVINNNRGLGNAAVRVSVDAQEDPDRVIEVLKEIGAGMRNDDAFKDAMLGDLDIWGVDAADGATFTIAGQIRCRDSSRWSVQREFLRRVVLQFREQGIQLANPNRSFIVNPAAPTLPQPAPVISTAPPPTTVAPS